MNQNSLVDAYTEFLNSFVILEQINLCLKARRPVSQKHIDKNFENCFSEFNITDTNLKELIKTMYKLCNEYRLLPIDQKISLTKQNEEFAKKYNSNVNLFRKKLSYDSKLKGITYIPVVYADHVEFIGQQKDILTGEEIEYDDVVMNFSNYEAIKFVNEAYFEQCIGICLENCTFDDIFFRANMEYLPLKFFNFRHNTFKQLCLRIPFKHCATNKIYYKYSDDPQFLKLFANKYFQNLCNKFKNKITKLISDQFLNPTCKLMCVTCKCSKKIFGPKKNKVTCNTCNAELCGHGCGKTYHGKIRCDNELMMNAMMLNNYINSQCPSCLTYLEKIDGCNHMTCICKTEYCNLCGKEFEKNEQGHYKVTEHYMQTDNSDFSTKCELHTLKYRTNIVMPSIENIFLLTKPKRVTYEIRQHR